MRARPRRRFLLAFLFTTGVLVLAGWAIIFCGLYVIPANRSADLAVYQKAKLRGGSPAEIIFVGDSSLGNCLNAQEFSRLSGKKCLNLALNGNFGLEGSYEMIEYALARNPVRKVIVMQTADILTRKRQAEALIYVMRNPTSLLADNSSDTGENLSALVSIFFSGQLLVESVEALLGRRTLPPLVFSNDYVQQSVPLSAERAGTQKIDDKVRKSQTRWLKRMKAICDARHVEIIYVHGPLFDGVAEKAPKLMASINEAITKTGIPADLALQTISLEELGNSMDHVRPDWKDEFTRRYYEKLKGWLTRPDPD